MSIIEHVGWQIRLRRRQQKITQGELARAVGIRQPYLCGLERGRVDPRLTLLIRLADRLGVSLEQLLDNCIPSAVLTPDSLEEPWHD